MSERGVFGVDRGIWEHDMLVENAPFSRREAWLWLVSEAAWKPHRRRIAGKPIQLERGQIAASLRFIAAKWRWSEPRVRRFLAALSSEGMVDAKTDAGITVLTICKYEEYQRVSLPSDASPESDGDAAPTQHRRKVENRESTEAKKDSPSESPKKASRGTRLPEDWQSPPDIGPEFGLTPETIANEADKFRDYWRAVPGQRGVKLDWTATWRNWLRKAAEQRPAAPRTANLPPGVRANGNGFYLTPGSEPFERHKQDAERRGDTNFYWELKAAERVGSEVHVTRLWPDRRG